MSPRRSAKMPSRQRRVAGARAASRQPEFNELTHLVSDIRTRLSRLSQMHVNPADSPFQQPRPHFRRAPSAARVEAEALYRLVQTGRDSLENVRGLIAVPPKFEQGVKELGRSDARVQKTLMASLRFRMQVSNEFESIVAEDRPFAEDHPVAVAAGASSGNP